MPDREMDKRAMKPFTEISLFRWIHSLFGRKNSGFLIEQGICRNALELPRESTQALPKRGPKRPKICKFAVIFPVGRECGDRGPIWLARIA